MLRPSHDLGRTFLFNRKSPKSDFATVGAISIAQKGETMNAQTDTTTNPMQATEALPLEDNSLPANETLAEQQSENTDNSFTPTFIP